MPLDETKKKKAESPVILPGLTLRDRAVIYNRVIAQSKGATLPEKLTVRNLKVALKPTAEEVERFEIEGFTTEEGGLGIPKEHADAAREYTADIELQPREAQWLKDWFEYMSAVAEDEEVKYGGGIPNDDAFDSMFWKLVEPLGLDLEESA